MSGIPELVPVLDRHRFDEVALARHLAAHLPGFDGSIEVRQFQGGQSNPTFHVATGAGDYVLRKKPPGKLLPRAHAIEREYRIIRALEGSAVPVPRARILVEDERVIGTPFFVMDHVPGRIFFDRVPLAAPPADRAAIFEDMARVLAALHKVDWRAAGLGVRPAGRLHAAPGRSLGATMGGGEGRGDAGDGPARRLAGQPYPPG